MTNIQDMTDIEILKLAAKAVGLEIVGSVPSLLHADDWLETTDEGPDMFWNPFQSGDNAMRLVVNLGFSLRILRLPHAEYIEVYNGDVVSRELLFDSRSKNVKDRHAATLRAIVQAAAEIGKKLND